MRRRTRSSPPPRRADARDRAARSRSTAGTRSLAEPVPDEDPERDDPVAPPDLLPFLVPPAIVRDRNLVDAVAALENLCRQLGLDAEAVRPQRHRPEHVRPHHLVAGLHVA